MTEVKENPPTIGVEGSIFGEEGSQTVLDRMTEKASSDRTRILPNFIRAEAEKRKEKDPKNDWEDAINAVAGFYWKEEDISSGKDLKWIKRSLKESKEKGYENQPQRETLAEVYLAVREILFPELPKETINPGVG